MFENWEHSYNFVVNDSTLGSVTFTEVDCDSNVVVTVNVNEGYRLVGWSDGGAGNPRTFHLTSDTMVTAIIADPFFSAVAPNGQTLYYRIIDNTDNVEVVSQNTEVPYYSNGGPAGDLIIPEYVTNPNTGVIYNVVTIGYRAFKDCYRLTSVTLPNSLISIGESAFESCINISNVEFGNSLITIGLWNFVGCSNLSGDIILPESVRTIGPGAFQATNISSITIQNSLVYIESNAFPDCPNPKIYITDTFPPSIAHNAFGDCGEIYVPCQYLSKYDTALIWNNLSSQIYGMVENWEHSYNFVVNDSTLGSVTFTEVDCDSNVVVTVNVNEGYRLVGWSDGGSGNPRTFHLTGDTMVTAIIADPFFSAVAPTGQTLNYRIIENTNNVEIVSQNPSGNSDGGPSGDLIIHDSVVNPNTGITYVVVRTESYAFANCDNLISVVFPNSLTSVGYATFDFCDQISRVELGNSVTLIDDWSFSNCGNLSKIYLNSVNPPEIKDLTLESSNAIIYVPCQSVSTYQNALRWNNYSSRIYGKIENWEHSYNFIVNDSTLGSISFTEVDCDSNVVVTVNANANEGYRLVGWSDGGTGNPRTFHLIGDTMVTAIIGTTYFSAVAPTGQTLNYMIDDAIYSNNVTLTGYVFEGRPIGELIIPDSVINPNTGISYNVITIAGQSFRGSNSLTSVTIPSSVTIIGDGAFQECSNLTSAIIGNSVSEIQWGAFRDCGLTSITIPNSVATIGDEAFFQCYNLNTVYLTDTVPPSINQRTFQTSVNFYVPCLSVNDYQSAYFWSNLSSHIYGKNYWKHSYNFIVNDSIFGSATFSEVDCDSNIVVTVNENVGYRLIGWSDGGTGNPRTFHLVGDTMVTAILDYIPYSVTVQPNDTLRGIVMGNDTVHYGDTVVIAATANYGYHFSRWNDGNTNNPRTLTITQDKSFTAIFDKNNYNIVLSADTNIHGHMTGMGDYEYLDNITISAIANHGYHFTHWNDGDTNNPRVITLTQDTAFTAYFAKNIYATIVESSDTVRGSAMGNATTEYLDTVVISATANYGYHFSQWNDTNTNNPRTIVVTDNNVYTAIFDKNNYNIALSTDTNIHGYMTGMGDYEYLDNRTISAVPNYGYHFTHWNDGDTNNPRVITLTQDTAFTAYFANNTYTLTVLSNDSVLGEVSGSTVCEYLDTVSITATTIMPHYHFVQWSDGNTEAVRNVVVTCDSVVTAIFAIDTHSVVLAVNNDNYGTVTDGCNVPYGNTVTIEAFASEGYHFAEWSNGSRNNPETITVISDTMITAIFTDDVVPQICMVDVRDGYNTVLWEKGLEVMNYNIYREGDIAGSYEMVATVPYDSLSQWVDSVSRPTSRSYRYRMTATDIYGYESEPGDIHKTMHLTINKGIGNQWNLVWTEYEGTEYTTYIIYRGTNASNIEQIDVIPAGGNTTYTDENAQEGDVYYQVGVMVTSPCNPSKSSSVILSNIATNGNVGILDVDMTNIKVFSKDGKIIVHNTLGKSVQVFDMEGRTIFVANNTYSSNDGQVSISVPKSGVYLVKVGEYPARKVVVIK